MEKQKYLTSNKNTTSNTFKGIFIITIIILNSNEPLQHQFCEISLKKSLKVSYLLSNFFLQVFLQIKRSVETVREDPVF